MQLMKRDDLLKIIDEGKRKVIAVDSARHMMSLRVNNPKANKTFRETHSTQADLLSDISFTSLMMAMGYYTPKNDYYYMDYVDLLDYVRGEETDESKGARFDIL